MHDDIRNFRCLSAAAGQYTRYHKRLIDVHDIIQNMEPLIVNLGTPFYSGKEKSMDAWIVDRYRDPIEKENERTEPLNADLHGHKEFPTGPNRYRHSCRNRQVKLCPRIRLRRVPSPRLSYQIARLPLQGALGILSRYLTWMTNKSLSYSISTLCDSVP